MPRFDHIRVWVFLTREVAVKYTPNVQTLELVIFLLKLTPFRRLNFTLGLAALYCDKSKTTFTDYFSILGICGKSRTHSVSWWLFHSWGVRSVVTSEWLSFPFVQNSFSIFRIIIIADFNSHFYDFFSFARSEMLQYLVFISLLFSFGPLLR